MRKQAKVRDKNMKVSTHLQPESVKLERSQLLVKF